MGKMKNMQTILDLSYVKARRYLLEPENYCNIGLPKYIDFQKVLEFVQKKVGNTELADIVIKDMPSMFEGVNYKVLIKKDAKYSYRTLQLANPYLYYLMVKKITNKSAWNEIKDRFRKFADSHVEVISIPKVKSTADKSHQAASVSFWWEGMEQRSLELALQYQYMFVTDITNCYPSMYTHSVAWAMMGKTLAKQKKGKSGRLGNIIDTYIQGMQYGQTNGIPLGSTLFDFIAEMILGYADKVLCLRLKRIGIDKYRILRYRDDYRIFSNSRNELEKVAFHLQEVLADFNLQLNVKKTTLTEDIVTDSIKADKIAYMSNSPFYHKNRQKILTMASSLQQEALFIHQFGKNYPNSGTLIKLLNMFAYRLPHKLTALENVTALISIFVDIAFVSPKTYKIVLAILSELLDKYPTTRERENIIRQVYDKFQSLPNIGELQIWLQRITFKLPNPIDYSEKLCKLVANDTSIQLWNNDWVKDNYKVGFPIGSICNVELRDSLTPIINVDEISLFDIY